MSRLNFRLYERECELIEQLHDSSDSLEVDFSEDLTGFLRIGNLTARLSDGKCQIDLRLLENGDYTPELVLDNRLVVLPLFRKFGNLVECIDCTDAYIRAVSQRERALSERVKALEEKTRLLEEKVYGTVVL